MTDKNFENMMEEMIDFTAETLSKEEEEAERVKLTETLQKVSSMLEGKSFERKCKEQAKKYGVNEKFIKNTYASSILNSIADTTGVVIELIGEAFNYLVRFVAFLLQKVMDIAVGVLKKLVNIITFRKEVE